MIFCEIAAQRQDFGRAPGVAGENHLAGELPQLPQQPQQLEVIRLFVVNAVAPNRVLAPPGSSTGSSPGRAHLLSSSSPEEPETQGMSSYSENS